MWFRLARELSIPVGELQARMSAIEFVEWMAYWDMEPSKEVQFQTEMAAVRSTLFTVHDSKGRKHQPKDFLLKYTSRLKVAATAESIKQKFKMWTSLVWNKGKDSDSR